MGKSASDSSHLGCVRSTGGCDDQLRVATEAYKRLPDPSTMGTLDDRAEVAVGMLPRDGDWEKERAATVAAAEAAGADPALSERMRASFDRRVKQLPASMKGVPRLVLGTRLDVSAALPHDQSRQVQAYPEEREEEVVFRTVSPPCAFCEPRRRERDSEWSFMVAAACVWGGRFRSRSPARSGWRLMITSACSRWSSTASQPTRRSGKGWSSRASRTYVRSNAACAPS